MAQITASIVGASGYSGAELLRVLSRHRNVKLHKLFANTSAGKRVDEVFPVFRSSIASSFESYSAEAACSSDVVFITLPSGEAMHIVPELLQRGKRIVDLGGDFRLREQAVYEKFYKRQHKAPDILPKAVYGLPEWNRENIRSASLVSNPGCYPTSAILPLAPLLKEGLIQATGIAVNSLSGVSGAGRSSSSEHSFVEVNESVKAYKVGDHQHTPEITQTLQLISQKDISLTFVPHLLPMTRGIYTTIYAQASGQFSENDVVGTYDKYYKNEPFVRYSSTTLPEIKNVNFTNYVDIGFRLYPENNHLIVLSSIDNLIKGAAGQAVQNMNIMFGFGETEGLL